MSIISGTIAGLAGANATTSAATIAAQATNAAADTATAAQNHATDVANQQFLTTQANFAPFLKAGTDAIPAFNEAINSKFTYDPKQSPSAAYQLEKGSQALNRAMASRGLSGSGTAANRLGELNRSVAASDYQTGYNNAYTQWNNQYSRILDALKLGTGASTSMGAASNNLTNATQAGATNLGNIAQNAGTNLANIYTNQGNNQASLYSGLGGQGANAAALGLKAWQTANNAGKYNYNNTGAGTALTGGNGSELANEMFG
jgi:hypothetical protein